MQLHLQHHRMLFSADQLCRFVLVVQETQLYWNLLYVLFGNELVSRRQWWLAWIHQAVAHNRIVLRLKEELKSKYELTIQLMN